MTSCIKRSNTISLNCRPLLYGLSIKENSKFCKSYQFDSKDYQVTPGSLWNYAIRPHILRMIWRSSLMVWSLLSLPSPSKELQSKYKLRCMLNIYSIHGYQSSLFLGPCVGYMGIAAQRCSSSTSVSSQVHQSTGNNHSDSVWSHWPKNSRVPSPWRQKNISI